MIVPNLGLRTLRHKEVTGLPKLFIAKTVIVKETITNEIAYILKTK